MREGATEIAGASTAGPRGGGGDTRPPVTAVIPTYNYGRFVAAAVDSVLAQTYAPLECVVVDDGSTDDTPRVLAPYAERHGGRVRVVRKPNGGLSSARNAGVLVARGQYVALLDADDWWKPDKIEKQVRLAEATPGVGAVGCGLENVAADGSHCAFRYHRRVAPPRDLAGQLRQLALRKYWVGGSGSGALVPRAVFDAVGLFDETLRAAEDWDMWLRIGSRYPIVNVPEVLVVISLHGTGTFRNPEKMETAQRKVYEAAVSRSPDVLDGRTRRRMRAMIAADAAGEYAGGGDYEMAVRKYLSSLKEWPLERRRWYAVARLALARGRRRWSGRGAASASASSSGAASSSARGAGGGHGGV